MSTAFAADGTPPVSTLDGSTPDSPGLGLPVLGEVIEGRDRSGNWHKATVTKINGRLRFVHYEPAANLRDEWLISARVRPFRANPTTRPSTGPAGGATHSVNEKVEAQDTTTAWFRATILKVNGAKYFVHYDDFDPHWDAWVTAAQIRPRVQPGVVATTKPAATEYPAVAPPQAGAKTLDGWFLITHPSSYSPGHLDCRYFWFRPDGRIYFGRPAATLTDFASLEKSAPENCGTYGIIGNKLTLQQNGRAPETHTYVPSAGTLDGGPLSPVARLKNSAVLDGSWHLDLTIPNGDHQTFTVSTAWTFHSDSSFEGTGHATDDPHRVDGPPSKGKYAFVGNNLKITYDGGKTRTFVDVFAAGSPASPRILIIDGDEYVSD